MPGARLIIIKQGMWREGSACQQAWRECGGARTISFPLRKLGCSPRKSLLPPPLKRGTGELNVNDCAPGVHGFTSIASRPASARV